MVKELIEVISEREEIIKEAKAYEDIKSYNRDRVRTIYKEIIPLVSNHPLLPPVGIREHIINFRFLGMQDIIKEQREMIDKQKDLINKLTEKLSISNEESKQHNFDDGEWEDTQIGQEKECR